VSSAYIPKQKQKKNPKGETWRDELSGMGRKEQRKETERRKTKEKYKIMKEHYSYGTVALL
jgi:hypothetical protein